jgi:hypothetical protein
MDDYRGSLGGMAEGSTIEYVGTVKLHGSLFYVVGYVRGFGCVLAVNLRVQIIDNDNFVVSSYEPVDYVGSYEPRSTSDHYSHPIPPLL